MYDNNYLMHYGVLGMKWGVRRYQNADGTRTRLGKARERASEENRQAHELADRYVGSMRKKADKRASQASAKPTYLRKSKASRSSEEYEDAKKLAKRYTDSMDKRLAKKNAKLDKIEKEEKRHQNVNPKDVKRNMDYMSDAELRTAINRIQMQQDINRMNPSTIDKGMQRVKDFTKTVGVISAAIIATDKVLDWTGLK